ncbi:hypothetical protein [Bradyrhizobium sp. WSM1253]|uniref:hypothetical protein n=1 Tax=Bradyrhizobium TaxID=374 RepID=UPI00025D2E2A|nr:hypothetical protein [Bradyrhizobium sp. WSM1253]EIG62899.1 hypothetical protein Bra1253DRAFT_07843 [Bradyrhizobium sp. WSM1253]
MSKFRERIEAALRKAFGPRGLDRGEKLFGLRPGELRMLDYAEAEAAEYIEDLVLAKLRDRADALKAKADAAAADVAAFQLASRERLAEIELAEIVEHDDLVDRLLEVSMPGREAA